jgi:hypothetical protein
MDKRTCRQCNQAIPSERTAAAKYCSTKCGRKAARDSPTAICAIEECPKPVRAKALCASHYNQTHSPNRHAKRMVPCSWCGAEVLKHVTGNKARRPVCSESCRGNLVRRDNLEVRLHSSQLVGPVKPRRIKPYPTWQTELPAVNRRFVNGHCVWCGDQFTSEVWGRSVAPLCCSPVCTKRRQWANKGQTSNWIVPRRRYEIYERDNWTCQLCNGPVDKTLHVNDQWAASLDHIIPQSHQLVPDHSSSNLRLAHRWCNAVLGDGTYYKVDDLAA